ncbi:MAG TPA: hypothetical protein VJK02_17820, partial [Anaerolineales bacterium]|nr:hypothetical protein [Anaerolineales bacterium]
RVPAARGPPEGGRTKTCALLLSAAIVAHRTDTVPSASSPRDAGGRNAACPAGPSLTPGIARFTGAKASVSTVIAL